ncbi:MAG: hypothetical protein COT00_00190 [Candidatus Omnitrophica bacterium CG07_land_8_20_14_0_80_50_8]|nr:MAG: hypothetical protein COT00_00190 [Candidatus Omnitrophica bacterium CG07_land_8_20_14_0_80_50_8]
MTQERRKFPRLACRLASSFRDTESTDSWSSCFVSITDISRGGMRLRTHRRIPLTARPNIEFVLPNPYHKKTFQVVVAPVWSSEMPETDSFDIGVSFIDLSAEAEDAIGHMSQVTV